CLGRRGVSLPFTDFCTPLSAEAEDSRALRDYAVQHGRARGWQYLEWRGPTDVTPCPKPSLAFYGHVLDLTLGEKALFQSMDGAVRAGIRKARAAGLQVDLSASLEAMRTFYGLHCRTRKRHGLPPQPFRFFERISRHVLEPGHGFVATARLGDQPLASAVFFQHKSQAIYKFGASDFAFQQLRPNNLLMWEAIRRLAAQGL